MDGEGVIKYKAGSETIKMGDSFLIPASMGNYEVRGSIKLLKSYVPDVEVVEKEILRNIKA